jgi:hypothetical protein
MPKLDELNNILLHKQETGKFKCAASSCSCGYQVLRQSVDTVPSEMAGCRKRTVVREWDSKRLIKKSGLVVRV